MATSGVKVSDEAKEIYSELKGKTGSNACLMGIKNGQIVVLEKVDPSEKHPIRYLQKKLREDPKFSGFIAAKIKAKQQDGFTARRVERMAMFTYNGPKTTIKDKMLLSSTSGQAKTTLSPQAFFQANDEEELGTTHILSKCFDHNVDKFEGKKVHRDKQTNDYVTDSDDSSDED